MPADSNRKKSRFFPSPRKKTLRAVFFSVLAATPLSAPNRFEARDRVMAGEIAEVFHLSPAARKKDLSGKFRSTLERQASDIDFQSCIRLDDDASERAGKQPLLDNLLGGIGAGPVGRALLDVAQDHNVTFCKVPADVCGAAAVYRPGQAVVTLVESQRQNPAFALMVMAHEIMHAAQDRADVSRFRTTWDLESRLRQTLAKEAAGVAAEAIISYEQKLAGNPDPWDFFSKWRYPSTAAAFEEAFNKSLQAQEGEEARIRALRAGGSAAWRTVFKEDSWLDYYLRSAFVRYIEAIAQNDIPKSKVVYGQFPQEQVEKTGRINNDFNFTQGNDVPSFDRLFKKRPRLRMMFEAVELERHVVALGASHPETLNLYNYVRQSNNPYLGLTSQEINARLRKAESCVSVSAVIDELEKQDRVPPAPPSA